MLIGNPVTYLAVGLRGRWVRRQEMRCEGYCGAVLSALLTALCPRLVTAIYMRSTGQDYVTTFG